jgi:polyribonucleotide nucleotidyltransferase
MSLIRVEREIGGRTLSLETGKLAMQAHGAVTVTYGETVVLCTVLSATPTRDLDFFPLYVDYRENRYAGGKIPGGFFKREGRPSTKEVITMRMIDRPNRPMFPEDFTDEVQIQCMTLSFDNVNDPDLLAMIGASAALHVTPVPYQGPVGTARVGYVDGEYVLNPTLEQMEESDMDLLIAGPPQGVNMIEMDGMEMSDEVVAGGIEMAFDAAKEIISMIEELGQKLGEIDRSYTENPVSPELKAAIAEKHGDKIRTAKQIKGKTERSDTLKEIQAEVLAEYCPEDGDSEEFEFTPAQIKRAFYKTQGKIQRELIMESIRPDGRAMDEVRPLEIELDTLPRTHGSAIFSRGETQALCIATLGTPRDMQIVDGLMDEYKKPFSLHYNFPPFSVGEIRPIRGPSRRDYGHGVLAEKSLQPVMPDRDNFPYTAQVVAEMLGSNGSTSQATICGATLALMAAGVPISAPVAGISIGMVSDEENYVLLTDIMGEEDFHGDMDFKVAGTKEGITAIQLDMKAPGIAQDRIVATLKQAYEARVCILDQMTAVIAEPRPETSSLAPRIMSVKINPSKIGKVIGPGGKTIHSIQDETGATIDIEEDGTVMIFCLNKEGAEGAKAMVENLTAEAEMGKEYTGKIVSIRDFGAFIEILPGLEGLCHVSELSNEYVKNVKDVVDVGDTVQVKVINIDDQGRVKLSRKATM